MNKQELLDFFKYLDRRGFLREDLQCNPEHHVMVYLRDFYNKPTETQGLDTDEISSDGHGGFTTKKELESGQCIATCDIKNKEGKV